MSIPDSLVISMSSIYTFLAIDAVDTGSPLQNGVWYIKLTNNSIFEKIAVNKSSSLNIGQWLYLTIGN